MNKLGAFGSDVRPVPRSRAATEEDVAIKERQTKHCGGQVPYRWWIQMLCYTVLYDLSQVGVHSICSATLHRCRPWFDICCS